MIYHLYFHNDFDGIASGAVMLNFLCLRGDNIISFNPIDYTPEINKTWTRFKFKKPFILVDFRYHPEASWWFDHHETSFSYPSLPSWRKKYRNDTTHYRGSRHKSCCSMIAAHLKKYFGFKLPGHIRELAKWDDIIDAAGYKSARETLDYSKPAMQLGIFLANDNNLENRPDLIKKLAERSMKEIVSEPSIKIKVRYFTSQLNKYLRNLKNISKPYNSTVFIDATGVDFDITHYMSYLVYPKTKYSVILKRKNAYYCLGVGKNPWARPLGGVDIGRLMLKYEGGGHKNVGATQNNSKKEIMKTTKEIIECLK